MVLPKTRYGLGGVVWVSLWCVVTALDAHKARFAEELPLVAAIQARPDFSGQWILQSASAPGPDVPRTLSVRHSPGRMGRRGDIPQPEFEKIAIDRELTSGVVSESHQIGIIGGTVGGIAAGASRPGGQWTRGAVEWDGNALVFEAGSSSGATHHEPPWTERREVWSIDERDRLHVAITSRTSGSPPRSQTLLYRRR